MNDSLPIIPKPIAPVLLYSFPPLSKNSVLLNFIELGLLDLLLDFTHKRRQPTSFCL